MAQSNSSRFAILATLIAFGLVGGISFLLWLLTGRVDRAVLIQANNSGSVALSEDVPEAVRSRVSMGEEVLFPAASDAKREGVEAIAQGDFASAVTTLNAALSDNQNDPESFIYRSNARIATQKALTIAVIAPAGVLLA